MSAFFETKKPRICGIINSNFLFSQVIHGSPKHEGSEIEEKCGKKDSCALQIHAMTDAVYRGICEQKAKAKKYTNS